MPSQNEHFRREDHNRGVLSCVQGDPDDELAGQRARALETHDLPQQHMLRRGPLSPKLRPCLAIMAADAQQLELIIAGTDPLQAVSITTCLHKFFPSECMYAAAEN